MGKTSSYFGGSSSGTANGDNSSGDAPTTSTSDGLKKSFSASSGHTSKISGSSSSSTSSRSEADKLQVYSYFITVGVHGLSAIVALDRFEFQKF
ncbi:hypothetical protein KL925_002648 [Ogataea polymorpha]|nr:hypothetical protein KL925_002648 [Ogataea polymorpha]